LSRAFRRHPHPPGWAGPRRVPPQVSLFAGALVADERTVADIRARLGVAAEKLEAAIDAIIAKTSPP
jgi:hypothetical protein